MQKYLSTSKVLFTTKMTLSAILTLMFAFMGLHAISMYTWLRLPSLIPNFTILDKEETIIHKVAAYVFVTFVACLGLLLALIMAPVIITKSATFIQYQAQLILQCLALVNLAPPGRKTGKVTRKQLARNWQPIMTRRTYYPSFISSTIKPTCPPHTLLLAALCIILLLQEPTSHQYASGSVFLDNIGSLLAFWGLVSILRHGLPVWCVGGCEAYSSYTASAPRRSKLARRGRAVRNYRMHTATLGVQYRPVTTTKTASQGEAVAAQVPPPTENDSGFESRASSPTEKESTQSENIESEKLRASQATPKIGSKGPIDFCAAKRLAESLAKDQQNVVNIEAKMLAIRRQALRIREMLRARKPVGPEKGKPKECSADLQKEVQKPKIRSIYKLEASTSHRSKTIQPGLEANITCDSTPEETNSVEDCGNKKDWPVTMEEFDAIFN